MVSIPSLGSFGKAFLFMFGSATMLFLAEGLRTWPVFSWIVHRWASQSPLDAWMIICLVVFPVLTYGYLHYFFFGKARDKNKWFLSWESLGEGFWMWGLAVLCLIVTIANAWIFSYGEYLLSDFSLRSESSSFQFYLSDLDNVSDFQALFCAFCWIVACAYAYHWRSLVSQWWHHRQSNKADKEKSA